MHQWIFLSLQKEAKASLFLTPLPCLPAGQLQPSGCLEWFCYKPAPHEAIACQWRALLYCLSAFSIALLVKCSVFCFKQVFRLLRVCQWQRIFFHNPPADINENGGLDKHLSLSPAVSAGAQWWNSSSSTKASLSSWKVYSCIVWKVWNSVNLLDKRSYGACCIAAVLGSKYSYQNWNWATHCAI